MPAIKTHLLISAAFSVALLSGCQTNTAMLSTDLSTGADVALNATAEPVSAAEADVGPVSEVEVASLTEADLALPETVPVVPASYAATENTPANALLAAAAAAPETAAVVPAEAPAQATAAQPAEAAATPSATAVAAAAPAAETTVAAATAAPDAALAPMAGGEIVAAADAPKLAGEFPPAPTIAEYALPARAPVPRSYQVASLGNVMPEDFAAYAAPDTPALASRGKIDELITKYAALYEVPERLVRRVVQRESTFNPHAYNRGHWGLMQIKHSTARGMGYDGPANGLLDAETNLKFAVKYLRGALLVAEGDEDRADRLYQSGFYYHAKRMGLLDETGLGRDRVRHRG